MSYQKIRAHIESRVYAAFQALSPPVEVVFDNVQETPPALPYVICLISYSDTIRPVVSVKDGPLEQINGNLQLSCYAPRGQGMKALEEYATTSWQVMNSLYEWGNPVSVKVTDVNGPQPLLASDDPYALVTTSAPFYASVATGGGDSGDTGRILTNEVDLTNPTTRKTRTGKANTKEVGLTHPVGGMTTQEDANQHFDNRLKALEADQHPLDHNPEDF